MTDDPPLGALEIPATASVAWTVSMPAPTPITLTTEAARILGEAEAQVQQAQAFRDALLTGMVAQAGIRGGQVVEIQPGPPMVLLVKV